MADQDEENESETRKSDENKVCDPRLDFFSDKFDPLLALKTPDLKVPDPNAKRYDNIAIYESAMNRENNPQQQQQTKKKKKETTEVEVKRRWLPHQLPVKSQFTFTKKNVFTKMESMKGPLAVLTKCVDERLQIKVWTRHQRGIRGYCLGYLVAFDKHWNLALEEVFEFWTRPKKRKIPALDSVEDNYQTTRRLRPPRIKVTPHETDKKLENCCRNVGQFMMRGEHIVFINVINEDGN